MTESILRVTAKASQEISASLAKLHFAVEGETFLFGNAALDRSRILKELVLRFKECGATDADFNVKSVSARVDSGLLGKSSKAEFKLELTVSDLSKLPDYLGVIATAKNVSLEQLEWVFETDAIVLELSAEAMKKAFDKAAAMANAVGHRVLGIRNASDSSQMPERIQTMNFSGDWMSQEKSRAPALARVSIGTEFKATREVTSEVSVEFYLEKPVDV
jgi:Protein of unknown function (DUF541)